MKLSQLRDLLAIAERGSIRAAARHLRLAQPTLTRSIRELERELGAPLLERNARGTLLTPMGQLFVRRASAASSELRRAREEIEQWRGGTQGELVACLSAVPFLALLPYALPQFRARFPAVRLRLLEGVYPVVEARLKDGTIDCYIGVAPDDGPGPDMILEKLFDNARVVLGRRGHPLSSARSLADLVDAEWITTSITARAEAELGELFARHDLAPPRLIARTESMLSLLTTLAASDLIAIAPKQWTESPLTRDVITAIPVREPLPAPPIVLIRRSALPLTPAAEYFCDMIRRASGHVNARSSAAKDRRA